MKNDSGAHAVFTEQGSSASQITAAKVMDVIADSERSTKVASRKHIIFFIHFLKDRNCDVCLRTKITKASCTRRTGEASPRAEKFGDLITADHKVLNKKRESGDNHQYAVVVQDLATQRIQSRPCKTVSAHDTGKKLILNSWNRPKHQKLCVRTTRWNLRKHVRFCHEITALQHLIDPRQNASLKEPSDE